MITAAVAATALVRALAATATAVSNNKSMLVISFKMRHLLQPDLH